VLGLTDPFLGELAQPLLEAHAGLLPADVSERLPALRDLLRDEEAHFARVLTLGLRHLARLEPDARGLVPGAAVFALFAARGFPPDLAGEVLAERGLGVDWPGYARALEEHRAVSRVSAQRRFGEH
jgi:alanyl-tRNA synthetase